MPTRRVPGAAAGLIREVILQLKKGYLDVPYFRKKFDVDIVDEWRSTWDDYAAEGYATVEDDRIELSRAGLLRVDAILPAFFESQFQHVRYT